MIHLPDFIIIPYPLLADGDIGLIDERLYGIIYWFTKLKNEKCTASNTTLSLLVKTTPATIQNSLTKLEEKGFIKRIFSDSSRRRRQEIIPLVVFSKVSPIDDTVSPTSDTQVSPTSDQNKNNTNKNSKKTETSSVVRDFIDLFKVINPTYKYIFSRTNQREACKRLLSLKTIEEWGKIITFIGARRGDRFCPRISTPLQLEQKYSDLETYALGLKSKNEQSKNTVAF